MYYFACRCTNEVIHANSMIFVEIASKSMHIEEGGGFAAANSSVCMVFDAISTQIHAISMYNFICAETCEIIHAIIMYFSPPWGGTLNVLGNIR